MTTINIHGTLMYDLTFQIDGESTHRTARVGGEALNGPVQPGTTVHITFLMNVVTAVSTL
jgi:hypothetical protein